MAKEPEKVLPEQRLPAFGWIEEIGPEIQVEHEHGAGGGEHRHGEEKKKSGDEEGPDGQGHPEEAHAGGTHINDGRDVVECPHDGGQSVDKEADRPKALPHTGGIIGAHRT